MAKAPERISLSIPGPVGALEALLELPAGVAAPTHIGVICHPHPQHEGTMLNKVVHTLARAMHELGAGALRFNFRGVGASAGHYAEGEGELDDALAVVDYVRQRWPDAELWLAGFSFGGVIAARAAITTQPARLITVAPAVNILDATLTALPGMPWLIVQGDADEIVPAAAVAAWVASCSELPGAKPELQLLPGAGHFFHGQLVALRTAVTDYLR